MSALSSEVVVSVKAVHKKFGHTDILKGIDITVGRSEVVCLMGPSGSGKTTLLRCINHLEVIDGGLIEVCGEIIGYARSGDVLRELSEAEIAKQRSRIGMVFQRFNLFAHKTVLENVSLAQQVVLKRSRREADERSSMLLARVGLSGKLDQYPSALSGGQQQRVAIARALAMDPQLVLFDEPTSALDPELVGEVLDVMRKLASTGMTMIVVTHEIAFAKEVADRAVFMADGVVVEHGSPSEVISKPVTERAASFFANVR